MPEPTQDRVVRARFQLREAVKRYGHACRLQEAEDCIEWDEYEAHLRAYEDALDAALRPTEPEYLVRLPQSICDDADEVQSALAAGMVDNGGNPTVPLIYLTDEMCERAARVFKWVLESDECPTEPTPEQGRVETEYSAELLREVATWLRNKENKARTKRTRKAENPALRASADRTKRFSLIAVRVIEKHISRTERIDLGDGV